MEWRGGRQEEDHYLGEHLSWGEDLAWSPGSGKLPLPKRGREAFVTPLGKAQENVAVPVLKSEPQVSGPFCPLDPNFSP